MATLKYWLWLAQRPGLSSQTRLALLERFPTPEDIYFADRDELLLTEGVTKAELAALSEKDLSDADAILADCQRLHVQILTLNDASYPGRLRNIYDPPCVLYIKGRLPAVDETAAISVVGTRDCTPYGIKCAEQMAFGLAEAGAVVVTGLARGIDSAAAQGALRAAGSVIGVLGNGVDVVYPKGNEWLYDDVVAAGALVSEYPPGTRPLSGHFPLRNRIMSGLSLATLVVEAPARSGALITAGLALEQGRDVFAIPGPIDAKNSKGCNRLIRDGAALAAEPWDILREYEAQLPGKLNRSTRPAPEPLGELPKEQPAAEAALPTLSLSAEGAGMTDDQILVLRTLTDAPMLIDELIELTGLPARRVLSALTMLELDEYVLRESGKRYTRGVIPVE